MNDATYEWTGSDNLLRAWGRDMTWVHQRLYMGTGNTDQHRFPIADIPAAIEALQRLYDDSQRRIIPLTDHYRVVVDGEGERVEYRNESDNWWPPVHRFTAAAIIAALHMTVELP